jgi:hypothetical protein
VTKIQNKKTVSIICLFLISFLSCTQIIYADRTSNSWIMDEPDLEDEIPLIHRGTTKQWWGFYGITYTEDRSHELLLDFNILWRGTGWVSFTIDGDQYYFKQENNPSWDPSESETFLLKLSPTVHLELNWYPGGYRVFNISSSERKLVIESWSRGIPLWHARTEDEMVVYRETIDGSPTYLAGFGDCISIKATLTTSNETLTFSGAGMYGRAWTKGAVGDAYYKAVFVSHPEFYIQVIHTDGPYTGQVLLHAGRIGFPERGLFYRFDNFTYWDSGPEGLAQYYTVTGTFEGGEVYLTGEKIGYLRVPSHHGYLQWNGTVTINGETIKVAYDAFGSGEIWYDFLDLKPAEFIISDLSISPSKAKVEETITISVRVTNVGELGGSYTIEPKVADELLDSKIVTLMGGKSTTVTFELIKEKEGTFEIEIYDLKDTLIVGMDLPQDGDGFKSFTRIVLPILVVVIVIILLYIRKRT